MTKKDYELFANEIYRYTKQAQDGIGIRDILIGISANVFSKDNENFNYDKYRTACYEGKHIRKSIKGEV